MATPFGSKIKTISFLKEDNFVIIFHNDNLFPVVHSFFDVER